MILLGCFSVGRELEFELERCEGAEPLKGHNRET